jgi:hypothetical protein
MRFEQKSFCEFRVLEFFNNHSPYHSSTPIWSAESPYPSSLQNLLQNKPPQTLLSHLQDGRALPENYMQFTHGYAGACWLSCRMAGAEIEDSSPNH